VGVEFRLGLEPLFLARSLGAYHAAPVRLVEFAAAGEVIRAFRNGLLDAAAMTAADALVAAEGVPEAAIILVCDFSRGADALLARHGIVSTMNLRGRRVGMESGALGPLLLSRALEDGGLTPASVNVIYVPALEMEAAFARGDVDALVATEPLRTRLTREGARSLFDTSRPGEEMIDVIVIRRNIGAPLKRGLRGLISGWFDALGYLAKSPYYGAGRMGLRAGSTAQEILDALHGVVFVSRDENLRLFHDRKEGLAAILYRLQGGMHESGVLAPALGIPELDDSFLAGSVRLKAAR
jgi:NitT/TauT family transport system substrate-binding protein